MDSLLANYASSDEEEENSEQENLESNPLKPQGQVKEDPISKSSGFFSSLPPPKSSSSSSSSLFFSLRPPKSHTPISTSISSKPKKLSEEEEPKSLQNPDDSKLSKSLPKPSSSLFSSLPEPKSSSSSSLFSSLPPPKTHNADPQIPSHSSSGSSGPAGKKVIQFRPPPMNPSSYVGNEDEDEEDGAEKEKQKQKSESVLETSSVKSFLSSIPAPKNSLTLGALPSAGSSRRSILEADVPASNDSQAASAANTSETGFDANMGHYGGHLASGSSEYSGRGDCSNWSSGTADYIGSDGYAGYGTGVGGSDYPNSSGGNVDYANYSSDYGSFASDGQYSSNWADESTPYAELQVSQSTESALRFSGKRGRNDAPQEVVEVKQEELMKNRPREDQVRLTGIAFGPSYQPASTKGKPSKLHKRKHQIGSLYFDMKQKETELAERRARGFLTKAQTQGKYGW